MDVRIKTYQEATAAFANQKFEYTAELCWKSIKVFLKEQEGTVEASLKKIIKAHYLGDGTPLSRKYITLEKRLLA